MIAGSIISAVASGLMAQYNIDTSTCYWIASLILSGMGFGLSAQQCMMVPQNILKGEDIALGTSVIMFAETISGTVFLAVCESAFQNKLISELLIHAPAVNPAIIVTTGASNLRSVMSEIYGVQIVEAILESYSKALQPVWITAALLGSLSLLGAVCTEWVSVKEDKKKTKREGKEEEKQGELSNEEMNI